MSTNNLSRRDFLKGAAAGAVGVAAMDLVSGCGSSAPAETAAPTAGPVVATPEPADAASGYTYEELTSGSGMLSLMAGDAAVLGTGPEIDESKIVEVIDCDVCVCGAGITGLAAARAASEEGAKVVVLEKNATIEVHGFQCGVVNSYIQKNLGAEVDPKEVLNEYQRRTVGRANMKLASLWANHSGEVFDWWYDAVEDKPADMVENVTLAYYPLCPEHDPKASMCKTFLGSIDLKEDRETGLGSRYWIAIGEANYQKSVDNGVDFRFSTPAIKLITDADGNVTGVYGKDADGNIYQVNATKGVILTTGGLCMFGAGSEAMHKVFAPTLYKNSVTFNGKEPAWAPMFTPDMGPISGDTGDGQMMGIWAGALMDPYGDCAMGSAESGIGGTVSLCVNQEGVRF